MTAPCAARQRRPLDEGDRLDGVCDRNQRVALPPEEPDRGKIAALVRYIEKVAMLPSPVDDVPHAARECACRAGHRVDARELRDLVRLVCATGGVQGHECAPGHEWLTEALDDLRDR